MNESLFGDYADLDIDYLDATYADDVETAFRLLETGLTKYYLEPDKELPAIAKSRV